MADGSRRLHSVPQAREELGGVGRSTVYRLVERGQLDLVHIGRRAFVTGESIDRFISGLAARD